MRHDVDIHNFLGELEACFNKIKKSKISESNKKAIFNFQEQCLAEGLGTARILKYVQTLYQLSLLLRKNFKSCDKNDIAKVIRELEKKNYSEWTKHDYKVALKKFYKWLRGIDEGYPEEVKWIKTTVRNSKHKLPEELLTEEDIQKLVESAEHPRDKALVFVLYESGCRIGELSSLRIKNIQFDEYGAQIIVGGKTGMRRIRLISSVPSLASWINIHPERDNPEAPLWVSIGTRNKGIRMNYSTVRTMLQRLANKAGIKKRINPHLFRHSRATHLASHLTEAQMKEFFGWVQGSEMASIYVHLSGRDVDDALLKIYGLKKKESEEKGNALKPKKCPRCEMMNPATSKFCSRCAMALDIQTAMKLEDLRKMWDQEMAEFVKDPEVQRLWMKKRLSISLRV